VLVVVPRLTNIQHRARQTVTPSPNNRKSFPLEYPIRPIGIHFQKVAGWDSLAPLLAVKDGQDSYP